MRALFASLFLGLLASCASYTAHQEASRLAQAGRDDQACIAQGWHYPEPRYVSCRRELENARLYKSWMSLQMMHQTQQQSPYVPPAYPYRETYRPLDPDHYRCRYTTENDQDYVLCGEDSQN